MWHGFRVEVVAYLFCVWAMNLNNLFVFHYSMNGLNGYVWWCTIMMKWNIWDMLWYSLVCLPNLLNLQVFVMGFVWFCWFWSCVVLIVIDVFGSCWRAWMTFKSGVLCMLSNLFWKDFEVGSIMVLYFCFVSCWRDECSWQVLLIFFLDISMHRS